MRLRTLVAILLTALSPAAMAGDRPISGSEFLLPETKALQDDDFANPGMLWVELGTKLWAAPAAAGPACQNCHGEPQTMRGVGAQYPKWSAAENRVMSLEQQINRCRSERQHAPPLAYGSDELLGLTALVMRQSHGMPLTVATDGPAAAAYERGRHYYETRRGQLNLACSSCHVDHVGGRLRGETISQGQANGFPIYRQLWQDIGSVGRMIAWCNEAVRAEPLSEGSPMAVDLELYLKARGNGLAIETPAVRR